MIVPPIPKFHEFSKIFSIGNKISPFFIQLVQILVVKENSWNFGMWECREQLIYITNSYGTVVRDLKAKQKLGRTFNSDKLGGIAFTKISKLTMCSA